MKNLIYDNNFFACQLDLRNQSAKEIATFMYKLIEPKSVVDVGCGLGSWLSSFRELGVRKILGFDGDYIDTDRLLIPKDYFTKMDLSNPIPIEETFDIAICLEVAEHIQKISEKKLVGFLTSLSPIVLFSAAIPGQGGQGHVNEQWPTHWSNIFEEYNYRQIDLIRPQFWNNENVQPWYSQNAFLYINNKKLETINILTEIATNNHFPTNAVHPELFKRYYTLEYIQSNLIFIELLKRIKRKLFGNNI